MWVPLLVVHRLRCHRGGSRAVISPPPVTLLHSSIPAKCNSRTEILFFRGEKEREEHAPTTGSFHPLRVYCAQPRAALSHKTTPPRYLRRRCANPPRINGHYVPLTWGKPCCTQSAIRLVGLLRESKSHCRCRKERDLNFNFKHCRYLERGEL